MRAFDRGRGILGGVSPQAARQLLSLGRPRVFEKGDVVFADHPAAARAALITEGLVKLTAVSAGDHETLLWVRGGGDLLGERAALRGGRDAAYDGWDGWDVRSQATALTPVTARVFPAVQLRRFLDSHPDALAAVARELCERLEEAESRIASAGRDNAARRLARLLCDLERYGDPHLHESGEMAGTMLPVKLSQAELASWIGACRETVERNLRGWRQRGIVSTAYRTIVVYDLETLARIGGVEVRRRTWNWPVMPAARPPAPRRTAGLFVNGRRWA